MTASFVQYLERLAYFEAEEQYCIKRENQRIAMPELFDVIAGTETGAIIGASLVIPGNGTSPEGLVKNYAEVSKHFFKEYASKLYVAQELNFWENALVTAVFCSPIEFFSILVPEEKVLHRPRKDSQLDRG